MDQTIDKLAMFELTEFIDRTNQEDKIIEIFMFYKAVKENYIKENKTYINATYHQLALFETVHAYKQK